MRRVRLLVIAAIAGAGGVCLPFAVERVAREIGPRRGPGVDQETALLVAGDARFGAAVLNEGLARLFAPVYVVTRVWSDPGHCQGGPGVNPALAQYRATVVSLTWFALPVSTIHVVCGGAEWSRVAPR